MPPVFPVEKGLEFLEEVLVVGSVEVCQLVVKAFLNGPLVNQVRSRLPLGAVLELPVEGLCATAMIFFLLGFRMSRPVSSRRILLVRRFCIVYSLVFERRVVAWMIILVRV
jgi:hypothetical protein